MFTSEGGEGAELESRQQAFLQNKHEQIQKLFSLAACTREHLYGSENVLPR